MRLVERVWAGDGRAMRVARAVLSPLGAVYGQVMRARRRLYDLGVLRSEAPGLPTISIGNLTVGGTGKTPIAAWVARRLRERARPAILLRGYGEDEVEVHRRLNPDIPVVVNPDRLAGAREAQRRGADVLVADDAFQHRRMRRSADVVLLSVEQLRAPRHALPAGPWRETLGAARAADLLVFTRKAASAGEAAGIAAAIAADVGRPWALVHLPPSLLVNAADGTTRALGALAGQQVLAIAAIGDPHAFRDQLAAVGATVDLAAFRDHHQFTRHDAASLAARVPRGGWALCTLKDAVKLAALWPGPVPLWYVSQQVVVEQGAEHFDQLLDLVLHARPGTTHTAG